MRHDPSLFDARTMRNDTRLEFKLKLLLGTVCGYGGEIPLSIPEIAKRIKTSTYRIRLLLIKLREQDIVRIEGEKIFFNKYKYIREKDKYSQEDAYAKNFRFFTCEEFLNEPRNVQRFVLHAVGNRLVYLPERYWWGWYKDLYGECGLLNIRSRKEAIQIVQRASKYLYISMHENNFKVTGVRPEWLEMGFFESEGAVLWVQKKLYEHRFCIDFISEKAIIQLAKVMEYYYAEFGYEYASEVFNTALSKIQSDQTRSQRFFNLIYRDEEDYIVNDEINELDEISAYFRSVMESAEIEYAKELSLSLQALRNKKRNLELMLFQNGKLVEKNNQVIQEAEQQAEAVKNRLSMALKCLKKRFDKDPEWFIQNRFSIDKLFSELPTYFYQIKEKMDKYLSLKSKKSVQYSF